MDGAEVAAGLVGATVGVGLVTLSVGDVRTGLVPVRSAQALTVLAVGGLAIVAVTTGAWTAMVTALIGAALVTVVQLVPYLVASRSGREWVGKADVRLGVPVGLALGWFGVGFAMVGLAAALVAGLAWSALARRRRVPFVPCLALGFWLALAWAVAAAGPQP